MLGLVPFFSGMPGKKEATGNSHAEAPRSIKLLWLKATVYTMLPWMAHIVVGVADEADQKVVSLSSSITSIESAKILVF